MHTSIKRKKKKGPITKYSAILLTILYYQSLLFDSLCSQDSQHYLSYCGCFPQFGPPLTEFRLQFVSISYLLPPYMANPATDDVLRLLPTRSSTTSIHGPDSHLPPDDPTSASYIPGAARMTPTSTTVHTIFIKKLQLPFSSRPDELWILERTLDGIETWKPVETFLENMHLTRDRATLRTTANHWRQYYDIPINHPPPLRQHPFRFSHIPNTPTSHVSQPYEAIPDQLHILQSCWGRSAQHHSQGTTISLSWPPWRSTPPSSPSATLHRTLHSNNQPYRTCSSFSLSTTCERTWPYGYV